MTADGMPQRATVTYLGSEKLPTPPGIPTKAEPVNSATLYHLRRARAAALREQNISAAADIHMLIKRMTNPITP